MAGQTNNPIQVGPPRYLRMMHPCTNNMAYIVSTQDQPLPGHFWMIDRVNIVLPLTLVANVANAPIICNLYHAPSGAVESSTGTLLGLGMTTTIQGADLCLCDAGSIGVSGTAIPVPFLTADEDHPIYIPENRIPIVLVYGYATLATQYIQVEIQYEDWMMDVPKSSPIPVYETSATPSS